MRKLTVILIALMISFIVLDLMMPQNVHAGAGLSARDQNKPESVITAEKPTPLKIWFGVGMLVAGILAVKYL